MTYRPFPGMRESMAAKKQRIYIFIPWVPGFVFCSGDDGAWVV
jgi:hypothetical protein